MAPLTHSRTAPFPSTEQRLGLYPVVDSVEWIERLLKAGVRTIQLRIALGRHYQARLFINDYWQLAIKHRAYGVHLGQEDLDTADLSAISAAHLRLGLSTHDDIEMDRALSYRPSYIALGHIFPTQTKLMPSAPQGLVDLKRQVARIPDYSTVAIGGISIDRVPAVLECGVGSVAVVSAITQAQDWLAATDTLLQLIENRRANDA